MTTNNNPARQSILIIGCGIAGPILASFLLLGSSSTDPPTPPPSITILERSPSSRYTGQNIDIRGVGVTLIRKLGISSAILAHTTNEAGVRHVDSFNRIWGEMAASSDEQYHSPTSDIEILRGRLAQICEMRCRSLSKQMDAGVEFVFGDFAEEIEEDGAQVRVKFHGSGKERHFDVVVGADGLMSSTRRMVWGEKGEEARVKGVEVYGAFFSMPSSGADGLWRRWYRAPGGRGVMVRPGESRDRSTVTMLVCNDDKDPRFRKMAALGTKRQKSYKEVVAAQKGLLNEYFDREDFGWEGPRIVREMMQADDFYYAAVAQVKMDEWSKGRVVLLGDAGYCASPLSGLGTTLSFVGSYNLAAALLHHPHNPIAAFAQYETKMRPFVERAQKLPLGGRAPFVLQPRTRLGIVLLYGLMAFLKWSRIQALLLRMLGKPKAKEVWVEEYGWRDLVEMKVDF